MFKATKFVTIAVRNPTQMGPRDPTANIAQSLPSGALRLAGETGECGAKADNSGGHTDRAVSPGICGAQSSLGEKGRLPRRADLRGAPEGERS